MTRKITHINAEGKPGMVDVSSKTESSRQAIALAIVKIGEEILYELEKSDFVTKKGSIFQTAIIAGTMAVKKTAELIPLCHSIPIENCKFEIDKLNSDSIKILCTVSTHAKTGVEMEALTGASIAALTIYDMTKALSHSIEICSVKLLEKSGGKSHFSNKE